MENEGRQQYIGMGASDVPETSNFSDLDLHQLRRSTISVQVFGTLVSLKSSRWNDSSKREWLKSIDKRNLNKDAE